MQKFKKCLYSGKILKKFKIENSVLDGENKNKKGGANMEAKATNKIYAVALRAAIALKDGNTVSQQFRSYFSFLF